MMKTDDFSHKPVMLNECIELLNIRPDGVYVDCTAGGGGHSSAIAERLTGGGRLICVDRDEEAISACRERLRPFAGVVTLVHDVFSNLKSILAGLELDAVDGALLDLGVSSHQIDTPRRGFSFMSDAPLDMRMDAAAPFCARDIVNTYSEAQLADLFFKYGEERYSRRIAADIAAFREKQPIETTGQLADIIKYAMPAAARREDQHPAKRTFQALRIAVNDELGQVEKAAEEIPELLKKGGRICVMTFHSLEDRIVKQAFALKARDCVCPPEFPVCVCGHRATLKLITKKPVTASAEELKENRRSASAKLRVAERL